MEQANAKGSIGTFLIEGKDKDVANAKDILTDKFGLKGRITVQVPASARSCLLGPYGTLIQSISNSTGASITIPSLPNNPKKESVKSELNEEMMDVIIFGEMWAICKAGVEIQNIVKSMSATKRIHYIRHIENTFYPLIAGTHNQRINKISTDTGTKIHVPFYNFDNLNTTFADIKKNYITITGDGNSVKVASKMIEDLYEDLKMNTYALDVDIPKRQHRYLIGPNSANLHEILETTGCVLELPPATDQSVKVIIYGPQNQLAGALQTVIEKANSMHVQQLDITDFHQTENLMKHSINVLKYLWNGGKLKKIESETVPEDVENARKEVTEIIKNLPPSCFDVVMISQQFNQHVIGCKEQNLQRIKDAYGVEIIVPDEKEANPGILIVFEGRKDFSVQTLTAPVKHYQHIIKNTLNTIIYNDSSNGSGGAYSPVSLKSGSSKSSGANDESLNTQQISDNSIVVKGPAKEVEEINEKVEDVKRIENTKPFTAEFKILAIYASDIICKEEIKFICDNYNVTININNRHFNEGKNGSKEDKFVYVKIVGMKVHVEKVRSRILSTVNKLNREIVVCVIIPPQYHASLRPKVIANLTEKYGVRIQFPKQNNRAIITTSISSEIDESEDGSNVEKECKRECEYEDLDLDEKRSYQVLITGNKRGTSAARLELLNPFYYIKEYDDVLSFTIPAKYVPHIVGRKSRRIKEISIETSTKIKINRLNRWFFKVTVHGYKMDNIKAQNKILEIIKDIEEQAVTTININPRHHSLLFDNINEIIAKAGGPKNKSVQAEMVRFPGRASDVVLIKANKELVEKIKEEFEILINEQEKNLIIDAIKVPRYEHSVIRGKRGCQLHKIENKFNVELHLPGSSRFYNYIRVTRKKGKGELTGDDLIKIIGKEVENVELAKEEILSILQYEDVFKFPCKLYNVINDNGSTSRKLTNMYNVQIKHQTNERKQISTIINKRPIFKKSTKEKVSKFISWTLKGARGQVEQAIKYLNELLEQAVNACTGYLSIPQTYHRHIIGGGGSVISYIRRESQCVINMPEVNDDDTIVIIGSKENIVVAKDMIFEILINWRKEQNRNNRKYNSKHFEFI
ncbi:6162_t:CDS:10 [Entrophospora sp. SA101]|nr:279_t:CDS:10 [Entrophospora sp. SA101]CAJ0845295.1 6162_t:CDS:10 [Entrophospora sp. SA101]CAJ0864119.1 12632_t:CDS:10 [Entrophospora sp. SA101]